MPRLDKMADNYLEKKMEDYRRRPIDRRSSNASVAGKIIKLPALRVFMAGKIGELEKYLIKGYTAAGSKVIFCHDDNAEGRILAQQTGGLHFPSESGNISWNQAFDFAVEKWGSIDVIVLNDSSPSPEDFEERLVNKRIICINRDLHEWECPNYMKLVIPSESENVSSFVKTALFLSVPENYCLRGQVLKFP